MILIPIGDINSRRKIPFVNYLLLSANIGLFIHLFFFYPSSVPPEATIGHRFRVLQEEIPHHVEVYRKIVERYGMIPSELGERPWTLLTSLFLHGGLAHLISNMLFLWIAGDNVEERFGHGGYLLFYLFAGVAAGLLHWASGPRSATPCIGASGAISGVLAAYMLLFPHNRIRFLYWFFLFIGEIHIRSLWAIGIWFVMQVLAFRSQGLAGDVGGVAYGAHVGGFLFGGIATLGAIGFGYVKRPPPPSVVYVHPRDRF